MREAKTSICHVAGGTDRFILLSVAGPAVDAHMAHGDGRVGGPVPGQPGMKFSDNCRPTPLVHVTLVFAGITVDASPFSDETESGFTISAVSGNWEGRTTFGNPGPSILFTRAATDPTTSAEAKIFGGGSIFSFSSVDVYSSITPIPWVFTGLLNSNVVFTAAGQQPNTFGNFATVPNPRSMDMIDTLLIRLSNPATLCCPNPVGFDNVVLVH
jgi:hypothetical protein